MQMHSKHVTMNSVNSNCLIICLLKRNKSALSSTITVLVYSKLTQGRDPVSVSLKFFFILNSYFGGSNFLQSQPVPCEAAVVRSESLLRDKEMFTLNNKTSRNIVEFSRNTQS